MSLSTSAIHHPSLPGCRAEKGEVLFLEELRPGRPSVEGKDKIDSKERERVLKVPTECFRSILPFCSLLTFRSNKDAYHPISVVSGIILPLMQKARRFLRRNYK